MPLPLILGGLAVLAGATGAKKAYDANEKNNRAKRINNNAQETYEKAKQKLQNFQNRASVSLTYLGKRKVDVLQEDMVPFVNLMNKIKNINMTEIRGMGDLSRLQVNEETLASMQSMGSLAMKMVSGSIAGIGAGAAAAFGAYGTAVAFGTAGTGTAIAGLSGAAATNATLAYLGGGTLAAGGLGVAGGTAVLGGIVAGPALAVLGFAMDSKANANLENARSNRAQAEKAAHEMGLASDACQKISERADMFVDLLWNIHLRFQKLVNQMNDVIINKGTEYREYGQAEKDILAMTLSLAVATKAILDTPILNEDGSVTTKSLDVYQEMNQEIAEVDA